MPPRLSHAELDRLIREVERRLSRSLLAALTRVRQGLPIAELERAILERNIAAASRTLGLEPLQNALAEIQAQLPPLREAGWASATQGLPRVILQESTLDITLGAAANERPDLLRAVAAQDLSRIRAITTETQQAFEDALRAGITKGTPPQVLARQVRGMLGLNRAQAGALDKFRLALETEARDPAQIERMVARKSQQYLNLRARTITQNETMRALNEGQRLQRERLVAEGVIQSDEWEQEWVTAGDERTCFATGSRVTTPGGSCRIEDLGPGDLVLTRDGEWQLLAVSARAVSGPFVLIHTSQDRVVLCTGNHPVWIVGRGWVEAQRLRPGDLLHALDNQPIQIVRRIDLGLTESDQAPTEILQSRGLSDIAGGVTVPEGAIDLDCELHGGQSEINDYTTDNVILGHEDPAGQFKGHSHTSLQSRLALEGTIAAEAAELAIFVPWYLAEQLSAVAASDNQGRPSTLLGAVAVPVTELFCTEAFATALAIPIDNPSESACPGTMNEPAGDGGTDFERLLTRRAFLADELGTATALITSPRTELTRWGHPRFAQGPSARLTPFVAHGPSTVVARFRAKDPVALEPLGSTELDAALMTGVCEPFGATDHPHRVAVRARPRAEDITTRSALSSDILVTLLAVLGNRHRDYLAPIIEEWRTTGKVTVYDIQVERNPEFFCEGFLVHNCPICEPLHGERAPIGGTFQSSVGPLTGPLAHVGCRCETRTVLKGFRKGERPAPARERILRRLGRFAEA